MLAVNKYRAIVLGIWQHGIIFSIVTLFKWIFIIFCRIDSKFGKLTLKYLEIPIRGLMIYG